MRRHVARQDSSSSSTQLARGSPSRGWPTLPGFSSHRSSEKSISVLAVRLGPRRRSVALAPERKRDVGVAHRADARLHRVHAVVRGDRRQDVLPHRVARARVVEPDRLLLVERLRASPGTRAPRPRSSRVHSAAAAACGREVGDLESVDHDEVVVPDQAQVDRLAQPARRTRPAARRSPPGRPGTRRRRRSLPRSRAARPGTPEDFRERPRSGRCVACQSLWPCGECGTACRLQPSRRSLPRPRQHSSSVREEA